MRPFQDRYQQARAGLPAGTVHTRHDTAGRVIERHRPISVQVARIRAARSAPCPN